MNITQAQADFIHPCVEAGAYNNASELVREALRLLKAQKDEQHARVAYLREELQKGFEDYEAERYIDITTRKKRAAYFEDVNRRGLEQLVKETDGPSAEAK